MSNILFDTHGFVKRLVGAGMPEQQAEILADEHARLLNERLANKVDLEHQTALLQRDTAEAKQELQRDLAETRTRLERDLAETKAELQHEIATLKVELQRELAETKADLQRQIAETKADLQRQIGDTKVETIKWVAGLMIAQAAVIVAILRLFL